ncbi:MAG TPA: pyridine nucleotide-disulfide oxidoreductase, partial [Myxococcaceae bacterium]|nr:pyridine nucleotide-disulfide oxidoreductase [Myxococcaceae bacterium]
MRMMVPDSTPPDALRLGFEGFAFEDLYRPRGLRRLSACFDAELRQANPGLFERFEAYRGAQGTGLAGPVESELLIAVSAHLSAFVARLFGLEAQAGVLAGRLTREHPLFEFKREFISRRVFKKGAADRPTAAEFPALHARMGLMLRLGFPEALAGDDPERGLAEAVLTLLHLERLLSGQSPSTHAADPNA